MNESTHTSQRIFEIVTDSGAGLVTAFCFKSTDTDAERYFARYARTHSTPSALVTASGQVVARAHSLAAVR